MPERDGQRIVDAITAAMRFMPIAPVAHVVPIAPVAPISRVAPISLRTSSLALIAANLVPIPGVLLLGWDLGAILLLYWVESGVIAFYTVLKLIVVGKLAAVVAVPFFIGHFGGFMTGHFMLLYALLLRDTAWQSQGVAGGLRTIVVPMWGSIAAMVVSHGISFYSNFLAEREFERASVSGLMTASYHRVLIMHLTLIFGGWVILLFGMPSGALVVLIALKTAIDLQAHRKEHSKGDASKARIE